MDSDQYERIQMLKQARALKELNKNCEVCGRPKTRHENFEANNCKRIIQKGLHQSVEPEKKARSSLV